MPMPLKIDRPHRVEVQLPSSLFARLQVELYSELEGRIPHGALSKVFIEMTKDWLKARGVEA